MKTGQQSLGNAAADIFRWDGRKHGSGVECRVGHLARKMKLSIQIRAF